MNTSNAESPTHNYARGGVFGVRLTVSTRGCIDRVTKGDTVVPAAGVTFALRDDIDSIQCLSNNFYFFQNSTLPRSIGTNVDRTNYNWFFGDGSTATGYNAFRVYQEPGIYRVKLTTTRWVTNSTTAEGCSDSAFFTLDVRPSPINQDSVIFSDTALCLFPNNFVFENRSANSFLNEWSFGDGQSAVGNIVNHTYTSSGRFDVTLEAEDAIGCRDTFIKQVEVFEQPDNSFTGLDNRYCLGDPASVLNPNLSGGSFYGLGVDADNNTFTPLDTGEVEVGYIVVIGNCRDTAKQTTRVSPLPEFELGNDTFLCDGSSFEISIDNDEAQSYSWSDGNGSQSRTINQGGRYVATAIKDGCSFRDTIEVEEVPAPSINIGADTSICGGNSFTLDVITPRATYRWQDGSSESSYRVQTSGTYWVVVTNACGEDSASKEVVVEAFACAVLFPTAFSPNGDNLNETFSPLGNFRPISFKIFNRWGELLFSSEEEVVWDGSGPNGEILPTGVYYYEFVYQTPRSGNWVTDTNTGSVHLIR